LTPEEFIRQHFCWQIRADGIAGSIVGCLQPYRPGELLLIDFSTYLASFLF
jgi:hypothetical protein